MWGSQNHNICEFDQLRWLNQNITTAAAPTSTAGQANDEKAAAAFLLSTAGDGAGELVAGADVPGDGLAAASPVGDGAGAGPGEDGGTAGGGGARRWWCPWFAQCASVAALTTGTASAATTTSMDRKTMRVPGKAMRSIELRRRNPSEDRDRKCGGVRTSTTGGRWASNAHTGTDHGSISVSCIYRRFRAWRGASDGGANAEGVNGSVMGGKSCSCLFAQRETDDKKLINTCLNCLQRV